MRLSFSQKLSRLAVRMKDPEWRRYASALQTLLLELKTAGDIKFARVRDKK